MSLCKFNIDGDLIKYLYLSWINYIEQLSTSNDDS
jgi:hypothetical protein